MCVCVCFGEFRANLAARAVMVVVVEGFELGKIKFS